MGRDIIILPHVALIVRYLSILPLPLTTKKNDFVSLFILLG